MKPAICIEMLYPGSSPESKFREIARNGFKYVEFWGHKDKNLDTLEKAAGDFNVQVVNFSGQRAGDLIDASTHPTLLNEIDESVPVARRLRSRLLMVLSNELGDGGRVVHPCAHIPEAEKHENLVNGLKKLMQRTPEDITIVLEPLNTVEDHPGYYLTSMAEAVRVIEEVGHPRLKILCDFYHLGLMGEDPLETARRYTPYIGHIHIADYPGRHEPGTGNSGFAAISHVSSKSLTIAWKDVLLELRDQGYSGFVGFEFSPLADSDSALGAVHRLWWETFGSEIAT